MKGLALLLALAAAPSWGMARFAVVLGNNVGAPDRARLWFAEKDAERFAATLTELGEFPQGQVWVTKGGSRAQLVATLERAEAAVALARASGQRTLLVVYFSGHAGAQGLELGREALPFTELRGLVEGSSADVKVAIVDACESGALTQVKGAKAQPHVDFALPAEDSAKGVAYIASTAVGETAQESAQLGSSFFTFHLEAALRGAGDGDGDGKVTLAEAFHYTSSRTVTGTSATASGPQHPTYDFRMSGRGDVVLSDLHRAEANLTLPGDERVAYLVSNRKGLVAESPGGATLALPAGAYEVERREGTTRGLAQVDLVKGQAVTPTRFEPGTPLYARAKGGDVPIELFAGVTGASLGLTGQSWTPGARLGLRRVVLGEVAARLRLDYQGGAGDDAGLRYTLHRFSVALGGLYPVYDEAVRFEAGLEVGWVLDWQALESGRSTLSSEGLGLAAVALSYPLRAFCFSVQLSGGARLYSLNGALTLGPRVEGALVLGWTP